MTCYNSRKVAHRYCGRCPGSLQAARECQLVQVACRKCGHAKGCCVSARVQRILCCCATAEAPDACANPNADHAHAPLIALIPKRQARRAQRPTLRSGCSSLTQQSARQPSAPQASHVAGTGLALPSASTCSSQHQDQAHPAGRQPAGRPTQGTGWAPQSGGATRRT